MGASSSLVFGEQRNLNSDAERDEKPIFEKEEGMTTIFQSDRAETQYIEGVLSELNNILRQNLDCSVMLTGKVTLPQLDRVPEDGIYSTALGKDHSWQKQLAEKGPDAFPGTGHQSEQEEEIRRLKRELEITRQERDILKKVVSIFSREQRCAYQFIEQYKQEFPVVVMCWVLSVSESGYYAWRKRPESQHKREDARLTTQIQDIFVARRGVYGSPRRHADLKDLGWRCSRKRVARLRPRKRDGCPTQAFPSHDHEKEPTTSSGP